MVAEFGIKVTAIAPGAFRTDFLDPHSIRKASGTATASSVTEVSLTALNEMASKQSGDPDRAAQAIITLVSPPNAPVHLLLGTDALIRFRASQQTLVTEMDEWEGVIRGTDYAT